MIYDFHTDICQIRLDFKSPTSLAQPQAADGVCNTDSLAVVPGATTTAANVIPTLCGDIANQHSKEIIVYV